MRSRSSMQLWTAVALAGTVILTGQAASATPPADSAPAGFDSAAISFYSSEHGVTARVASVRLKEQDAFTTLVTALSARYGVSTFDRWVNADTNSQTLNIRTDDPRLQRRAVAEAAQLGILIQIHDEPAFLLAAVDAMESVAGDDAVQGVYADVAVESLVLQTTQDPSTQAPAQRRGLDGTSALNALSGVPVTIENLSEPGGDDAVIRGGVALNGCTAGFAAKQGSYVGFYTASHCGSSRSYWANTAGSGAAAGTSTRRNYVHNANADIAFHSISGNTAAAQLFGSSSTTAVAVGSAADVAQGTTVCSRGRTSGYRCGTIASIAYKPTWSGACNGQTCSSLFVSVNATSAGGDSGGPWFVSGNRPIGINKGHAGSLAVYSRLSQAPSGTSLY